MSDRVRVALVVVALSGALLMERSVLSMAVAVGALYLMLELRPSGLCDPEPAVGEPALS